MSEVDATLAERGAIYGDYAGVALTSQALKSVLHDGASFETRLSAIEQESIDMIANKLARIVNGKRHRDSWLDIAGYAMLAAGDEPNVD